jgi:hypothetical protein
LAIKKLDPVISMLDFVLAVDVRFPNPEPDYIPVKIVSYTIHPI